MAHNDARPRRNLGQRASAVTFKRYAFEVSYFLVGGTRPSFASRTSLPRVAFGDHASSKRFRVGLLAASVIWAACGGPPSPQKPPTPTTSQTAGTASHQILGDRVEGTPKEIFARGERALLLGEYRDAKESFETLLAAEPMGVYAKDAQYNLGLARIGLGDHVIARAQFREVMTRYPNDPLARQALARIVEENAFLEDFQDLGETGEQLLAKKDATDVEKMLGLGARGLSRVEAGEVSKAQTDVQNGLDLVDSLRYGAAGRLPHAAAQLKYAQGEVRRANSEKIALTPVTPDFVVKIELRCQGLLDAQNAFADAIRGEAVEWAKMSGVRIGEMYAKLHRDLMSIPPTAQAKTEKDKELFYAIMHVRYRALLDKGIEMMRRTLALADKTQDKDSTWVKRAETAKKEMEDALAIEKQEIAKSGLSEAEVERAIAIMKEKLNKQTK